MHTSVHKTHVGVLETYSEAYIRYSEVGGEKQKKKSGILHGLFETYTGWFELGMHIFSSLVYTDCKCREDHHSRL